MEVHGSSHQATVWGQPYRYLLPGEFNIDCNQHYSLSLLTCYWMSATEWNVFPFLDEIHAKDKTAISANKETILVPPVSLSPTAAHILLDLNHNPAGSGVNIPAVDKSLEHLKPDNINDHREPSSSADLIQLRYQFLALLHAVDADDDDPSHGDAPDDEPKPIIIVIICNHTC